MNYMQYACKTEPDQSYSPRTKNAIYHTKNNEQHPLYQSYY